MTVRKLLPAPCCSLPSPPFRAAGTLRRRGTGAYGGYKAKESGYSLPNPVTKDGSKKTEKKESE
jgi:hypothetical protein